MPEEHNRVLADHAADLLLAPTAGAMGHLGREGLGPRSRLVGDVMADVCLRVAAAVRAGPAAAEAAPWLLATLHRPDNTDRPDRLDGIVEALAALPCEVRLAVHPRLRDRAAAAGISLMRGSVTPTAPLPYPELVAAVLGSAGVVTDSGGLQKEAYLLGRPCTTVRSETEWVETLAGGWNVLAEDPGLIGAAAVRPVPTAPRGTPYGDGHAAAAAVRALLDA
jgi:UDP-N-acetylglucosamine 2-epimerase (non-hydrolysing)